MLKIKNYSVVYWVMLLFFVSCQENFDNRLKREAQAYTQNNCPQEVEQGLWLDSLTYDIASRTYTSFYTANATNEQVLRKQNPLLHNLLLQRLVNNTDYKDVKAQGVTFGYVYRSETTKNVFYQTEIESTEYTTLIK